MGFRNSPDLFTRRVVHCFRVPVVGRVEDRHLYSFVVFVSWIEDNDVFNLGARLEQVAVCADFLAVDEYGFSAI